MDFLKLAEKSVVVFGVANKKSVAWHIGKTLEEHGAKVIYVVRSEARRESTAKMMADRPVYVCDVEFEDQIEAVRDQIAADHPQPIAGLVHSIAFAAYDESGIKPFHETGKQQLLRTFDISCYSLIAISNAFKDLLEDDASVVTISISTTTMASENYGFMAPVKAALDSSLAFWRKASANSRMSGSMRWHPDYLKPVPRLESQGMWTPICTPKRSFREGKPSKRKKPQTQLVFC